MEDANLPVLQSLREKLGAPRHDEASYRRDILSTVGDSMGWIVGTLFLPDAAGEVLEPGAVWTARYHRGEAFERATRASRFARGQGLPGRVWDSGEPAWLTEVSADPNFPRAAAARADGLHSGIGIPLVAGHDVVGVVEFFTEQFRSPLPLLIDVFRQIGRTIAPAFARDVVASRRAVAGEA